MNRITCNGVIDYIYITNRITNMLTELCHIMKYCLCKTFKTRKGELSSDETEHLYSSNLQGLKTRKYFQGLAKINIEKCYARIQQSLFDKWTNASLVPILIILLSLCPRPLY